MKVSTEKLPDSQVLLQIDVDPADMEKSMDRAYRKLVQRVDVPGFRKGKTPRNMLERHIGRGRLLEEAIDLAVPEAYNKALEEQDIDAIDQPRIEVLTAEPLSFKATVPIRPTVDLGDYKSVRVPRDPVEVDEKDVENSVLELQRRYAIHEPVDRPVQMNDIIRGDVRINVEDREVYKDEDVELHLREGRTVLLPGFSEGVVGAVKNEPKQVEVTLPDDADSSLAGKTAVINATIKEVKEEKLPDPDDDFASGVGEGFVSFAALQERLRNDIRERLEASELDTYQDAVLSALTESAVTMEYPPIMVDREIDRFLQEQARNTGMELDKYLELIRKTPEEVREELIPSATERVKRSLALSQLAEAEEIKVEDAEIDSEIDKLITQASAGNPDQAARYRQIFRSPEARASLSRSLLTRKTMERLVEIASQADGVKPTKKKSKPAEAAEGSGEPEAAATPGEEPVSE